VYSRRSSTCSDSSTLVDVPLHFKDLKDLYNAHGNQTQPKPGQSKLKRRWYKYRPSFTSALKTAITIGEASNLPYLKGVAGIILVIYNAVQVSFNFHSASAPFLPQVCSYLMYMSLTGYRIQPKILLANVQHDRRFSVCCQLLLGYRWTRRREELSPGR
jgi:hypothetical protein